MGYVTDLASTRVPVSLDELHAERVSMDDLTISYRILCACGRPQGAVTAEHDASADFWLDPYVFTCAVCGRAATLFDSSKHGYDGVLNGGSAYEQRSKDETVTCPQCGDSVHEVIGYYDFSFDQEEIETEWPEEERAQLPDLFSSVSFELICSGCGNRHGLGEFECA
jgi:hypothetical protein